MNSDEREIQTNPLLTNRYGPSSSFSKISLAGDHGILKLGSVLSASGSPSDSS